MRVLRHPRGDRPKPFAICRCRVRPHDTANVPVTIERIVVVGAPLAARAGFVGLFENEHVASKTIRQYQDTGAALIQIINPASNYGIIVCNFEQVQGDPSGKKYVPVIDSFSVKRARLVRSQFGRTAQGEAHEITYRQAIYRHRRT